MAAQISKLWHLEQINLFKNLGDDELVELDDLTVMKTAGKNEFIYFPKKT